MVPQPASPSPSQPVRAAVDPRRQVPGAKVPGEGEGRPSLGPQLLNNLAALPSGQMLPAALQAARRQQGGLAWFEVVFSDAKTGEGSIRLRSTPADDGKPLSAEIQARLEQIALEAARQAALAKDFAVRELSLLGQRARAEACPILERDRVLGAICRVAFAGKDSPGAFASLQSLAQLAALGQLRAEVEQDRQRFQQVAAFVELFGAVDMGTDFPECTRHLANHLRDILECDLVALVIRRWGREKLVAVSGLAQTSAEQSAGRSALAACVGDAMRRRSIRTFRRKERPEGIEEGSLQEVREWFDPALGIAAPLEDVEGKLRGGWIFLWQQPPADPAEREVIIRAAAPEVAPLLHLLRKAKPGPVVGSLLRLWRRASKHQRGLIATAATVIAGTLAFPVPYPVRTACELQPVTRRVIAAPFDGVLQKSLVRAGEAVKAGQPLAEMEGREIRWQLADAAARRARAQAEADQALASGKVAESRMAELEASSLEEEIAVLEYRADHLVVKAPLAGLVLQGDLARSEGAPLRVGDPLFEVGPLDRLLAELAVRESDIALLREKAPASFTLESFPGETFRGEVLRIAPRSEAREGENVFICEVELENPEGRLRPGLKGKARIDGPRRPLVWSWLRDAWIAVRFFFW